MSTQDFPKEERFQLVTPTSLMSDSAYPLLSCGISNYSQRYRLHWRSATPDLMQRNSGPYGWNSLALRAKAAESNSLESKGYTQSPLRRHCFYPVELVSFHKAHSHVAVLNSALCSDLVSRHIGRLEREGMTTGNERLICLGIPPQGPSLMSTWQANDGFWASIGDWKMSETSTTRSWRSSKPCLVHACRSYKIIIMASRLGLDIQQITSHRATPSDPPISLASCPSASHPCCSSQRPDGKQTLAQFMRLTLATKASLRFSAHQHTSYSTNFPTYGYPALWPR